MTDWCTWGLGDYHAVPEQKLFSYDRLLYLGTGWLLVIDYYCTWGKGDYHAVPEQKLFSYDRLLYLGTGWLPYCTVPRERVIPYDRLLNLGKGWSLMLEPEVVCSAELVFLVLFLGSSHALPSWHHHPASQIFVKKGQDSETLVLILCRQKKFCKSGSGWICIIFLDPDPHIKSWIWIPSTRQNCFSL
jgi:hypothetical protein